MTQTIDAITNKLYLARTQFKEEGTGELFLQLVLDATKILARNEAETNFKLSELEVTYLQSLIVEFEKIMTEVWGKVETHDYLFDTARPLGEAMITFIEFRGEDHAGAHQDTAHLGCDNFPNCDEYGCGAGDMVGHRG